ncbi:Putative KH domain-containing protein [Rhizopus microsporus]|nr:Putative KH domain-containing protein [Rhizopus microsporus]
MSDNETIDRSKRPRLEEEYDSEHERDHQDDRHPKRQAIPDPETKAPHFVPSEDSPKSKSPDIKSKSSQSNIISLRSLVSMKDAGLIIGRGGKNVSKIRESSMARVNVSDIIPSAVERILTVIGPAYALVAEKIIEESALAEENQSVPPQQDITIKILILSNRMGCIIGKSGSVIKSIQESSGARVTAAEEPLPLSSERVLSIHGTPQMIEQAVKRVGDILIEQTTQPTGYTLYKPIPGGAQSYSSHSSSSSQRSTSRRPHDNNMNSAAAVAMMGYAGMLPVNGMSVNGLYYPSNYPGTSNGRQSDYPLPIMPGLSGIGMGNMPGFMPHTTQSQQIYIPNEMVGCIIGRNGMKINEIRQTSGSHIKIADPRDDSRERLITITGTPESNQIALYLLYSRLEAEQRRVGTRYNDSQK